MMPVIRSITVGQKCEYDECPRDATAIVYSRPKRVVMLCCEQHMRVVADQYEPEYISVCPNCGCIAGVPNSV